MFVEDTTLAIYDMDLARLTYISLNGRLLRVEDVPARVDSALGPAMLVATSGRGFVLEHAKFPSTLEGVVTPSIVFVSRTKEQIKGQLGPLRGSPNLFRKRSNSIRGVSLPFSRRLSLIPLNHEMAVVDTERPEILIFDHHFRLNTVIRLSLPRIAVTSQDLTRHADSVVADYKDRSVRNATKRDILERPVPPHHPALISVRSTSSGELWILARDSADNDLAHIVFTAARTYCCTVKLPKGASMLDASPRRVLLRRREGQRELIELWRHQ
jgi:hypothetical protein